MAPYKRVLIDSEDYLRRLIRYIHYNPIAGGLTENLKNWRYTSYNGILSNNSTMLSRNEVLTYFNDRDNFIYWHKAEPDISTFF